jgi:hypothetical protein
MLTAFLVFLLFTNFLSIIVPILNPKHSYELQVRNLVNKLERYEKGDNPYRTEILTGIAMIGVIIYLLL